jgi:hypothetical protein
MDMVDRIDGQAVQELMMGGVAQRVKNGFFEYGLCFTTAMVCAVGERLAPEGEGYDGDRDY